MTSAIEALEEFGTCLESVWPYDISRVNTRPNDSAYQESKHHKITEAFRIDTNLHEMKACLAQGFPFAFGLKLYASFDQADDNKGIVPMPNAQDNIRSSHGRFIEDFSSGKKKILIFVFQSCIISCWLQ